ncbi:MAG: hypothetical protein APF77_10945 [Clostridia bacterium BRH_c25]|nr:MAG: hypothetical protein APF77_10945 [Clostridia bacterium BRH_c25]
MNSINIPIFEKKPDGTIWPNYVFHKPHNRIHSRCIEYPWCASYYNGELNILDAGSAKSDPHWIKWLEGLNANVYLADYDVIRYKSDRVKTIQCDIRNMDFEDNFFDVVFAVSVLEHIGLADPQVQNPEKPEVDEFGDARAFQELIRVLKPGGRLFLTVPFSKDYKLIFQEQARCYSKSTISRFNLPNVRRTNFDIYHYTSVNESVLGNNSVKASENSNYFCELPGTYCWKRAYNINECTPQFKWCVDCVALAGYEKLSDIDEDKDYYNNYLIACNHITNSEMVKFNRKYILYGTGRYSALITQFVLNLGGNVVCYSDTDPGKWGSKYLGKQVIPPSNMYDSRNEFYKVIIASTFMEDIISSLGTLGLSIDNDVLVYDYLNIQNLLGDSNFKRITE